MNVLVYLEPTDGGLKRSSYEAITAANQIANGGTVTGVVIGASGDQIQQAAAYGLTSCLHVAGAYANGTAAQIISAAAQHVNASVVLLAANATGKDVAPRVAVRIEAGLLADCTALHAQGDSLEATRPVYAGKALVRVKATTPITVATLRPNVFTAKKGDAGSVTVTDFAPSIDASTTSTVTGISKNEGALDVAEADIIVSGGRGLKGPEHFALVEGLAKSLGAAVGASRAVVDAGWRPHREQVGQTGKTVSPTMYVACGISGAVQHLAGMSSSKIIVAINKDKEAPIFKVADYGLVGDVFEILPKLTQKISGVTGR